MATNCYIFYHPFASQNIQQPVIKRDRSTSSNLKWIVISKAKKESSNLS